MQFTVESGTPVPLIKSADLKEIAKRWEKKSGGKTGAPLSLRLPHPTWNFGYSTSSGDLTQNKRDAPNT